MKVINVKALDGYKLEITFDDGVSGTIDLENFIGNGLCSI
jgi:hypothetical protein